MVEREIIREWLSKAKEDFEFAFIDARYPVHWPTHFSQEETQKALQSAKHIRSFVELKLRSFI